MSIQETYRARRIIFEKTDEAFRLIQYCQELIEDFTNDEIIALRRETESKLAYLVENIKKIIPRSCPCGGFEFEQKKVVTVRGSIPKHHEAGHDDTTYKYFCLKCGTELTRFPEER